MGSMLDSGAEHVLRTLGAAGYEAYLVGGCVRDDVLGRPVKDIDIATSALPEQVMQCFPRTAPTGLQHGTVTVIVPEGTFEVTTFRSESSYEGFRRPTSVAFITSLEEDLRRRDFTMNAMAMDGEGALIDPFGGRRDLEAGLLRCVGLAEERFGEDALRMLRCIRFASAYGLEIENATWEALLKQAPLLRHIAMERVRSELQRIVESAAPARGLRLLLASGLWRHFKRQLPLPFERWLARDQALDAVSAAPRQARWPLLLLLLETPADAVRRALQELTFSRAETDAAAAVVGLHEWLADELGGGAADATAAAVADPARAERVWKRGAVRWGADAARVWLQALGALREPLRPSPASGAAEGPLARLTAAAPALLLHGAAWLEDIPCLSVKELAVSGSDVSRELGREPGPWLGRLLAQLLELAALGDEPNEQAALLAAARRLPS